MSSKRKYIIEESSSDEHESGDEFEQVNDDFRLSNKKKVIPKKKLYQSISSGTKIKLSHFNPNNKTSVDEDDIQTFSNSKSIEYGSNDILSTNDLIIHKKKNDASKNIMCPSIPKKTKKKICYVNDDIGMSVIHGNDTPRVITPSESRKIERKSSLEYSESIGEINEVIEISSDSDKSLINYDSILPKKNKLISKKRVKQSNPKEMKRKHFNVDSDIKTSIVYENATQGLSMPCNSRNIDQESLLNYPEVVKIEQSNEANSENDEMFITTNDKVLSKEKKEVLKKRDQHSISNRKKRKISYVDFSETSVAYKDGTQIFKKSSNINSTVQKTPLDNTKSFGKIKQIVGTNSGSNEESNDILTTNGLILSKKSQKKKIINYSPPDKETSVDYEGDTREFITSSNKRNIKEKSYLEDSENIEEIEQSGKVDSENEEKLTKCDSNLSNKKKKKSKKSVDCSVPRRKINKMCFVNSDIETSAVHENDAEVYKTSINTSHNKQKAALDDLKSSGESFLKETKQVIEDNLKSRDILNTNDLVLPLKKRGRPSILKGLKKKLYFVDSDVETPVVHQVDTQRLMTSSNQKNIVRESSLEDSGNIEEFEKYHEVSPSEEEDKLTNDDLSSPKKVVESKKNYRQSITKKTMKKIHNDDSDIKTSVNDTQVFKISSNTRSTDQESYLDDSENVEKLEQTDAASLKSKKKITIDGLRLTEMNKAVSNGRKQFFINEGAERNISDVDSNSEISVIHEDDTQIFKTSSNTKNLEKKSFLDDIMDSKEIEPIKEENLENNDILTADNDILHTKKKVGSKKIVHCSTPKRTRRKVHNVDSNVETSVVHEDAIQGSKTSSNKITKGQIIHLNNTNNIVNDQQSIETNSESKISITDDLSIPLQKKTVSRKRGSYSTTKEKKKKINTNIISNNLESNYEYVNINEIQPRVLMENLSDDLLKKSYNKNLKTTDKNLSADEQISDEPSKPAVTSTSSFNLPSVSRFGRKIKPKKLRNCLSNWKKGSKVQKCSKSTKEHDKSLEEHRVESSETINLLEEISETRDISTISNSETIITTTKSNVAASIPLVNDRASEEIQLSNNKNMDTDLSAKLNDIVIDTSPNLEVDWLKVNSNLLSKIESLQKEVDMLDLVHKLRSSLKITRAHYERALESLQQLYDSKINALMLLKNTDVVDTIINVTQYVGNVKEWNVSENQVQLHGEKAYQIRSKANMVLNKFKSLFSVPDGQTFQEVYSQEVKHFLAKTKHNK